MDRWVLWLILSLMPILWLPLPWLPYMIVIGIGLFIVGILGEKMGYLLLGLILMVSYGRIVQMVKQADNPPACDVCQIKILKIQKQQHTQTAIAQRENQQRIWLNWQNETPLTLDATYQVTMNTRPLSARLNQGNFDRQKWLFAQQIQAVANVKQATLFAEPTASSWRTQWLERSRQQTEDLTSQGLLLALAFGERAWLKEADWRIFQQTSTAHLIAISGLHIALAMGLGFGFGKAIQRLLLPFRRLQAVSLSHLFPLVMGLMLAFGYSFLASFALPTQRAIIAISVILICQHFRRHYTPWQLWTRVVALLIIIDPLALLSDSFWLSILAVLSLIIWYRYFPLKQWHWLAERKTLSKSLRLLISLIHLQLGIWLVFSPVQLYFFEGISPFALIANLLIVPLYSFLLVPLILFSLATFNLLHSWQLADWLAQISLKLLQPLATFWWPLSQSQQISLIAFNLLILILIYSYLHHQPKRYLGWLVLPFLVVIGDKIYRQLRFQPHGIIFDVGQGLATAWVYQQGKAVIYDTGSNWQGGSMARLEILPYLRREQITPTAIFLSHDDNDHSGGVIDLLKAFPQARFISAGQKPYFNRLPEPCQQGKNWQFGDFRFSAISPLNSVKVAKNPDSCVLLLESHRLRVLLTGDINQMQEQQLSPQIGKLDLLLLPHHGSKTSTSHSLLSQTQPDLAVVSTGRWNRWKMPHQQVRQRLADYKIPLLNTAQTGMIKIYLTQSNRQPQTARSPYSPWYQWIYADDNLHF